MQLRPSCNGRSGYPGKEGWKKVKERRRWFSWEYYASVFKMREFIADNIGREFIGVMSDIFDEKRMKEFTEFYKNHPL